MKNLQKRILGSKQWVYCPLTGERCAYEADSAGTQLIDCAHYNPDTQECIHVEAARAQVRAADMLERAARAIEYLAECTTDPCIQPRRVLGITRE
jgi:sugar (pentulose or hexulose) kinase